METLPGCSVEGGLAGSKNGVGAGGETTSGAQRRGRGSEERSLQQGHKETIFTAASVRATNLALVCDGVVCNIDPSCVKTINPFVKKKKENVAVRDRFLVWRCGYCMLKRYCLSILRRSPDTEPKLGNLKPAEEARAA